MFFYQTRDINTLIHLMLHKISWSCSWKNSCSHHHHHHHQQQQQQQQYIYIFIRPTKRQFKCNWTCSRTGQWD